MTIPELAIHYRTSPRTINRMRAAGVDLSDPIAVAAHLVNLPQDAIEPLVRITEILTAMEPSPQLLH